MMKNVCLQIVRLRRGATGPCGVCDDCDVHDHFDRDLRELICAKCKEDVRDAEIMGRAWCGAGVEPMDAQELLFHVDFFNRSGARRRKGANEG